MKKLTILVFLFAINVHCFAQELKIGDHCPDVTMKHVMNYKRNHFRLSDFKGRFIILDFWGTGCSSCIAGFPHLDSLQHAFGNKIQIILVNKESLDSTIHFFALHPKIKLPRLPFATGDTLLSSYFPHNMIPQEVWMDGDRKVRAVTFPRSATRRNIEAMLKGEAISLPLKKDVFGFDFDKPIFQSHDSNIARRLKYYSYIADGEGIHGFFHTELAAENESKPNRIYGNLILPCLYSYAYGHDASIFVKKTLLLCSDSMKSVFESPLCYYYDLKVPLPEVKHIFYFIQQDLMKFFGLKGDIERRTIPCLVLVRTDSLDKFATKGGKPATNFFAGHVDTIRYVQNYPFSMFVGILKDIISNNPAIKLPFVDAVGYKGNVDIRMDENADLSDLHSLRAELRKNHLDLVKKEWKTDVLVLRDL